MKNFKTKCQVFLFCTLYSAVSAASAIDISQLPLETGTTVDPNILLMFDDSGSMLQGLLPEDLDSGLLDYTETIIRKKTVYEAIPEEDYTDVDMTVYNVSKSANTAFLASSHLNKLYYNPNITYPVPKFPDGTSLGNSDFYNAKLDGYEIELKNGAYVHKSTAIRLDLSTDYMAIMSRGAGIGTGAKFTNYAITPEGSKTKAFYYKPKSSCTDTTFKDNSCYDIVYPSTASERQNFANWFSYYRDRMLSAKAGISEAFHEQSSAMRVGSATINTRESINGVRKFNGNDRKAFFANLYGIIGNSGGTPLKQALISAGDYFETNDEPWQTAPGVSGSALLECRQSYTILMTDGYYTGNSSDNIGGEHDNENGETITGTKGQTYTYEARAPFAFATGNTLADIAMKYWKNDLRKDLGNSVPTSPENPAFWQHMVTFGVAFGVTGTITPKTAFDAISTKGSITWPKTSTNSGKIDDLLHAGVNSRGGFFSAGDPLTFAEALSATLTAISQRVGTASTAAATAVNSLQTESNLYQARFVSGEWSGDLWSYKVGDTNTPVWKASEKLPKPADRKIYFGVESSPPDLAAKEFKWANMNDDEKKWLGGVASIVDYLRGDKTQEKSSPGGVYRNRAKVLGDLVNSSPELVAEPLDYNYQRYSWAGASEYRAFINGSAKTRTPMLYVGGNDGMLHAFDAKTGVEKFAYIPRNVMKPANGETVNVLKKYSEPKYVHRFSVDGTPVPADVYINSAWRTYLVGGLGRGSDGHAGGGFYALDVTDPDNFKESDIKWDKSFPEVGTFIGKPQVTRMNSGQWVMILGYGYNNSEHKSGIVVVNLETGAVIKTIPTSAGDALNRNATSELSLVDINADGLTDWVYGGDMQGYVWKFDLSDANPSLWKVANNNYPLFQARDASNVPQMISGGILSAIEPKTGKVWLFFGTGRYINQDDPGRDTVQSWYGIQDGNPISARSELEQRYISNVNNLRTISASTQTIASNKRGWYMDLPGARERIVDTPMIVGTELMINTLMPDSNACNPGGTGYLMAVSPFTGGRLKQPFFDIDKDSLFDDADLITTSEGPIPPSGVKIETPGAPRLTKINNKIVTITNCVGPCVEVRAINPSLNSGMQSWREITK